MKKQLFKVLDTGMQNTEYVIRIDSKESSKKQQKARKKSKSVNRVNK